MSGAEQSRWRNSLWYLQQTVAPGMKFSEGERSRNQSKPIAAFDEWLWGKIEDEIDSGAAWQFEERFAKEHKPEAKARGKLLESLGKEE